MFLPKIRDGNSICQTAGDGLSVHGVYCPTANVQTMKQMTISKVLMRFKRILFLESKGPRIQKSETHTGSSSYSQISAMADAAYSTFICSATGAC